MYYLIYKITNKINGKFYVGKHQTFNLDDGYMGSGKLLKRAIKKYSIENFQKEILFECSSEEEMNQKEKELVVPDIETNYNICPGGQGGFGYINKNGLTFNVNKIANKETRSSGGKITGNLTKELRIGIFDPKHINKIKYDNFKGKKHSEETIRKMKESHKKRKVYALP